MLPTTKIPIDITLNPTSKLQEVDFDNLVFGKSFSDHMFIADCIDGVWQTPQILPFGNLNMSPATAGLHYGQSIFEGLKVHKNEKDELLSFRLIENFNRLNFSAKRMSMAPIPEEIFMEGIKALVNIDKNWVPQGKGRSLYIRPLYISMDEWIKVRVASDYRLIIFGSPAGPYFDDAIKVWVEEEYSRSAEGGTGAVKAAGNYGGSMYPTQIANERGYHQVIWTDASENKYIEETGAANVFFVIDGKIVTPSLSKSKLAGITRASIIHILQYWNLPIEERMISKEELREQLKAGKVTEAFATGTAVTIGPIATIGYQEADYDLPKSDTWTVIPRLRQYLHDLKVGNIEDPFDWVGRL